MAKGFLSNIADKLRKAMHSPGFEQYDEDQAEGYDDDEYMEEPEIVRPVAAKKESWQETAWKATAPKSTPMQGKFNDKIVELYGPRKTQAANLQVVLATPKDVSSSNSVSDHIRDGKICAVNLTGVERGQAQRIVDVIAGGIYALEGNIVRVSKDIFIATPEGVQISGELKEELAHEFPWASSR